MNHSGRRAYRIAEKIVKHWRSDFSSDDHRIPVAVTAALSLMTAGAFGGNNIAKVLSTLDTSDFTDLQRLVWRQFALLRPDLALRSHPLSSWLRDASDSQLKAGHRVGQAAIAAGMLDITSTDMRYEAEVTGAVLQLLRAPKARINRGSFYTSPDLADLIARINPTQPGHRVLEPAAGAGELVRAAALELRRRGHSPANVHWYLNDIDAHAAACLAVNAHVWGLGEACIVGCFDGLDPYWPEKAEHEKSIARDIARWAPAMHLASGKGQWV